MEVQNPFQILWEKIPSSNFTDFMLSKFPKYGSNLAMVDTDTGKQWRYSELRGWVEMCADRMREIGVNTNSRVAIITSTTGQALFVHFACSIVGAVAVCINAFLTVDEIWQQVDISESTHAITESQFLSKVEEVKRKATMRGGSRIKIVKLLDDVLSDVKLKKECGLIRRPTTIQQIIPPSVLADAPPADASRSLPASPLEAPQTDEETDQQIENGQSQSVIMMPQKQTSLIFFSAGTTGLNKAVEISHRSLIVNVQQISCPIYGPPTNKERFLLTLSLHHIFGAISAYYALANGATLFCMPKYEAKNFLDTVEEHKINVVHVTPTIIQMLAFDPVVEGRDLSSLRSIIVGGAPVDPGMMSACKERLQLKDLRQTYGMTEIGGICTLSHFGCSKMTSVGVPLPGMLVKIVNWESKELCTPNQLGQLLVMGPQVQPTFYKNPKATNEIVDTYGYLKTGDAAYYDEDGYIYILDRIKDLIKYKGALVCPSEVENIIRSHPGIDDCAVVGRQDHVSGEVPAAFVVKNAQHQLLASAEVRQHVAGKIAQFKELRGGVFFVPEIPRSICGKILRRQLKQYWDRERTTSRDNLTTIVDNSKNRRTSSAVEKRDPTAVSARARLLKKPK